MIQYTGRTRLNTSAREPQSEYDSESGSGNGTVAIPPSAMEGVVDPSPRASAWYCQGFSQVLAPGGHRPDGRGRGTPHVTAAARPPLGRQGGHKLRFDLLGKFWDSWDSFPERGCSVECPKDGLMVFPHSPHGRFESGITARRAMSDVRAGSSSSVEGTRRVRAGQVPVHVRHAPEARVHCGPTPPDHQVREKG